MTSHRLAAGMFFLAFSALSNAGEPDSYWQRPITAASPSPGNDTTPLLALDAESCGQCHPKQHAAWRQSLHAEAFSPGLAGQLSGFAPEEQRDCLRCHAPRAEQHREWNDRGLAAKPGGVDCAACHVRQGARFGPRPVETTPHGKVEASTLFRRAEFCSTCHQFGPEGLALNAKPLENTYEEWKATRYARDNITCQNCHMPEGRHEFRGIHNPEMMRRGLALRAVRERGRIHLTATNSGAGHHLPTYTTPLVRIEVIGAGRRREHILRRELVWDAQAGLRELRDTRLAAGESVSLALDLPSHETGTVLVTVDPGYDYHARIYPALLASPGAVVKTEARAMLGEAQDATRGRTYVLYRLRCDAWRGHAADCIALP